MMNIERFVFLSFIPVICSALLHEVNVISDDDCWSLEKNNTINRSYATLVKFGSKIAYGKHSCSIHMTNPWIENRQNGFGIFLSRDMDCSSTLTIECLSDTEEKSSLNLFTCHTSDNRIEIPCNTISLNFQRKLGTQEMKKTTAVQVVALAKGPCIDDNVLFQCPNDYPNSCIDGNLRCNGRSECPDGSDERDCHPIRTDGISIWTILLIVLALLFLTCILSTVLIFCCCRAAVNGILRRIRANKAQKSDVTITGEDAGLMKALATPATIVNIEPSQNSPEPPSLVIDSTKPIYPRLE